MRKTYGTFSSALATTVGVSAFSIWGADAVMAASLLRTGLKKWSKHCYKSIYQFVQVFYKNINQPGIWNVRGKLNK